MYVNASFNTMKQRPRLPRKIREANASRNDKLRIGGSLVILIIGSIVFQISRNQQPSLPGDADIMVCLIEGFSMIGVVVGAISSASLVLYALLKRIHPAKKALRITLLIVSIITIVCLYILIGVPSLKDIRHRIEIQQRTSNFVPYTDAPRFDTVSDISSSVTARPSSAQATSVSLDLHACAPGRASVTYESGTTYFAFSGIKQEGSLGNQKAAKCIFYISQPVADPHWDGRLPIKCTWSVSDVLVGNYLKFPVTTSGIQFNINDFLGNCQDLRTGKTPLL